ncbi:MAG: NAD-dependent epimerase/dehydratase family protein, partial [Dehalococcoidia bacterium]
MRPMRILITGGGGQLGRSLVRAFDGLEVVALSHGELDVADVAAVATAFERVRPDAVVHAAALTDTARCEAEPELARAVNAAGSENVARACASADARLVAVSTNEVFGGERSSPYAETDATGPL